MWIQEPPHPAAGGDGIKKGKSHLGSLRHSSTMVVGVSNVPIEVKWLSKPLMLKWDSVLGQCQLMVLTTLKDVDVILGMDVLSQFDVKIGSRNQVASPERELCTSLMLDENVRLPLENPTFTLEGKIQVKEEEAEEVIKGVHRQGHLGEHKTWKAFNRKFITTEVRKKCREIVRTCPECQLGKDYRQRHFPKGTIESSKPWDMEDREGYVKQLKRELGNIRAKFSRILGQERNQEENPFSVGERVIITILPHENRNKLLAKWKGPFTITKIPTRFQIEYLEDGVRRTTSINYAKKFCEHSLDIKAERLRHRPSCDRDIITMTHLRLVSGSGKSRRRLQVSSLEEIRRKWQYFSGPVPVRIEICRPEEELSEELRAIVEEAGAAQVISGRLLLDLCGQRSKEEGGSCDASQQQFLFKYETSVSKQPTRPTKFKLAYAQNASSLDKAEFGTKSCKKAKIYPKKSNDKFWNPCTYIIMCISTICIYLTKQVNKLQPVGLPTSTGSFVKLYVKVKIATETCQMVKKHYDKSNGNFWYIYGYVKIYVCMIYMYLTKQVNKLKLVGLPTKTSDFAKTYTLDKIRTESCQMVKKHNHKFYNRFWNAYSYLKGRIMEFGKYLCTVIPGRGSRKPLATPPAMGYKRRAETGGWQSGSDHSHPIVSVMFLLLNLLFLFCMHLLKLRYLTVCLIYICYLGLLL